MAVSPIRCSSLFPLRPQLSIEHPRRRRLNRRRSRLPQRPRSRLLLRCRQSLQCPPISTFRRHLRDKSRQHSTRPRRRQLQFSTGALAATLQPTTASGRAPNAPFGRTLSPDRCSRLVSLSLSAVYGTVGSANSPREVGPPNRRIASLVPSTQYGPRPNAAESTRCRSF